MESVIVTGTFTFTWFVSSLVRRLAVSTEGRVQTRVTCPNTDDRCWLDLSAVQPTSRGQVFSPSSFRLAVPPRRVNILIGRSKK